jgi:hypothetical protein
VVQSDASPDAFLQFMEILNWSEPRSSPQIADDSMLSAREFWQNDLIATFARRQDVPSRRENVRNLLEELARFDRRATHKADLLLMRDSLDVLQRDISSIREVLHGDSERILSELEKMPEK